MDLLLLVLAGALVGFAIGLTGVGGGSLMTPLLLLLHYPAPVAIGTDLLYAAFTKSSGVYFHHKKNNVKWLTMGLMLAGSIPVSLFVNLYILDDEFRSNPRYESLLTTSLGIMLVITSFVIAFQGKIQRRINEGSSQTTQSGFQPPYYGYAQKTPYMTTVLLGMALGLCVTLSSVGAGAFGAAILFILYPKFKVTNIVGTDIAHAVPLTLVAGLGYVYNGLVNYTLLLTLLCGSLPGIYFGTKMGAHLSERLMRIILVTSLLTLGTYFTFM